MAAGGIRIGKAFIIIEALDRTQTVLKKIGTRIKAFGVKMQAAGKQMMMKGFMALLPAIGSSAVFAKFDDSMRKVEARSNGTAEEMKELRKQAMDLGKATSATASQIGELQAKLAQKGFDRKEVLAMTKSVLLLGKAAGEGGTEDLVTAATLVSGSLRQFKAPASEAAKYSDLFTAAVNNSNFSLEGLSQAMSKAGPIANKYHLGIKDVVTTLAMMANVNIDPSMSGIALKNLHLKSSSKSGQDKFNQQLKDATGQTIKFGDANGNLKPIPKLLFEIGEATKNMGTMEMGTLFSDLFGLRAIVPALEISGSGNQFKELRNKFDNLDGTAQKTYDKMEGGVGGMFRRVFSSIEAVAIEIGTALETTLAGISKSLINMLGDFAEWIKANQEIIVKVTVITMMVIALGLGMYILGTAISLVGSLFLFLSGAILTTATMFVMLVSGVITAVMWLSTLAATITSVVISAVLRATVSLITFIATGVIPTILAITHLAIAFAIQGVMSMYSFAASIMAVVIPALIAMTVSLYGAATGVFFLMTAILTEFGAVAIVIALVVVAVLGLALAFKSWWSSSSTATGKIKSNVKETEGVISGLVAVISEAAGSIASGIGSFFSSVWSEISSLVGSIWTFVVERFSAMAETIGKTFSGVVDAISIGDFAAAWSVITQGMTLLWLQAVDMMMDGWDAFATAFLETWHGVMSGFLGMWYSAQKSISNGILELAKDGGILGEAMDLVLGVDVSDEDARGKALDKKINATKNGKAGADSFDMAKKGLNQHYDGKIDGATSQSGKALSANQKARAARDAKREAQMNKAQGTFNKTLKDLEIKKKEAGVPGAEDNLDIDSAIENLLNGAGGGVSTGSGISPGVVSGLEKGSLAAAEQFQKNKKDSGMDQLIEVNKGSMDSLLKQEATLQSIDLKFDTSPSVQFA